VLHGLCLVTGLVVASVAPEASAALWRDVTATALGGETADWSNKVELADLDGDGRVDLLFANGGNYNEPGTPELSGAWRNAGTDETGAPIFEDISADVFGEPGLTRSMRARDFDGDGNMDILVGANYQTRARLLMGAGDGKFSDRSDLLPPIDVSVGDVEAADYDGDGDLDLFLADWGLDGGGELLDPFTAPGAAPLLWRNDLSTGGGFKDVTAEVMDDVPVAWSWELDLWDIDGDFDLDLLVSCKVCSGSFVFRNEGGRFEHDPAAMPQFTNNYDFEAMWIQVPGEEGKRFAVVTINDGDEVSSQFDRREHLFVADGSGRFEDMTTRLWPDGENPGADDNMVVMLDFDSDGDADFLIGALGPGDDRLHVNDLAGAGTFVLDRNAGLATGLSNTEGTLGIALADLNGDGKLDVVQSQGELAEPEKVYVGDDIAADTAAPEVAAVQAVAVDEASGTFVVRARVHDNKSPSRPHDWRGVEVRVSFDGQVESTVPMTQSGGFLWQATVDAKEGSTYVVCATDAAGNEACGAETLFADDEGKFDDVASDADASDGGCGCTTAPSAPTAWWGLLGVVALGWRRRRGARPVAM
jgi:MYXO-CTERM domain-containing protein